MAGVLVSNYSVGDENIENMQLTLDKAYKGGDSISLTEIGTATVPAVAAGSWAGNNGALYKFDAEEVISTTDPVTSAAVADGDIFVCLIPAGATITAAFTATEPTWSDTKQGFYGTGAQANNRYIATVNKSGTSYTNKRKIANSWADDYNKQYFLPFTGSVIGGSASTFHRPTLSVWSDGGNSKNMQISSGDILIPETGLYLISMERRGNGDTDIWVNGTRKSMTVTDKSPGCNPVWQIQLERNDLVDFSGYDTSLLTIVIEGHISRIS